MSSEEKYAMSDEDVDLYGDLQDDGECGNEADPKIDVPEDSNLSTLDLYSELIYEDHKEEERSSEELRVQLASVRKNLAEMEAKMKHLVEENKHLSNRNIHVQKNISALFLTARAELKRKDRDIEEMRKKVQYWKRLTLHHQGNRDVNIYKKHKESEECSSNIDTCRTQFHSENDRMSDFTLDSNRASSYRYEKERLTLPDREVPNNHKAITKRAPDCRYNDDLVRKRKVENDHNHNNKRLKLEKHYEYESGDKQNSKKRENNERSKSRQEFALQTEWHRSKTHDAAKKILEKTLKGLRHQSDEKRTSYRHDKYAINSNSSRKSHRHSDDNCLDPKGKKGREKKKDETIHSEMNFTTESTKLKLFDNSAEYTVSGRQQSQIRSGYRPKNLLSANEDGQSSPGRKFSDRQWSEISSGYRSRNSLSAKDDGQLSLSGKYSDRQRSEKSSEHRPRNTIATNEDGQLSLSGKFSDRQRSEKSSEHRPRNTLTANEDGQLSPGRKFSERQRSEMTSGYRPRNSSSANEDHQSSPGVEFSRSQRSKISSGYRPRNSLSANEDGQSSPGKTSSDRQWSEMSSGYRPRNSLSANEDGHSSLSGKDSDRQQSKLSSGYESRSCFGRKMSANKDGQSSLHGDEKLSDRQSEIRSCYRLKSSLERDISASEYDESPGRENRGDKQEKVHRSRKDQHVEKCSLKSREKCHQEVESKSQKPDAVFVSESSSCRSQYLGSTSKENVITCSIDAVADQVLVKKTSSSSKKNGALLSQRKDEHVEKDKQEIKEESHQKVQSEFQNTDSVFSSDSCTDSVSSGKSSNSSSEINLENTLEGNLFNCSIDAASRNNQGLLFESCARTSDTFGYIQKHRIEIHNSSHHELDDDPNLKNQVSSHQSEHGLKTVQVSAIYQHDQVEDKLETSNNELKNFEIGATVEEHGTVPRGKTLSSKSACSKNPETKKEISTDKKITEHQNANTIREMQTTEVFKQSSKNEEIQSNSGKKLENSHNTTEIKDFKDDLDLGFKRIVLKECVEEKQKVEKIRESTIKDSVTLDAQEKHCISSKTFKKVKNSHNTIEISNSKYDPKLVTRRIRVRECVEEKQKVESITKGNIKCLKMSRSPVRGEQYRKRSPKQLESTTTVSSRDKQHKSRTPAPLRLCLGNSPIKKRHMSGSPRQRRSSTTNSLTDTHDKFGSSVSSKSSHDHSNADKQHRNKSPEEPRSSSAPRNSFSDRHQRNGFPQNTRPVRNSSKDRSEKPEQSQSLSKISTTDGLRKHRSPRRSQSFSQCSKTEGQQNIVMDFHSVDRKVAHSERHTEHKNSRHSKKIPQNKIAHHGFLERNKQSESLMKNERKKQQSLLSSVSDNRDALKCRTPKQSEKSIKVKSELKSKSRHMPKKARRHSSEHMGDLGRSKHSDSSHKDSSHLRSIVKPRDEIKSKIKNPREKLHFEELEDGSLMEDPMIELLPDDHLSSDPISIRSNDGNLNCNVGDIKENQTEMDSKENSSFSSKQITPSFTNIIEDGEFLDAIDGGLLASADNADSYIPQHRTSNLHSNKENVPFVETDEFSFKGLIKNNKSDNNSKSDNFHSAANSINHQEDSPYTEGGETNTIGHEANVKDQNIINPEDECKNFDSGKLVSPIISVQNSSKNINLTKDHTVIEKSKRTKREIRKQKIFDNVGSNRKIDSKVNQDIQTNSMNNTEEVVNNRNMNLNLQDLESSKTQSSAIVSIGSRVDGDTIEKLNIITDGQNRILSNTSGSSETAKLTTLHTDLLLSSDSDEENETDNDSLKIALTDENHLNDSNSSEVEIVGKNNNNLSFQGVEDISDKTSIVKRETTADEQPAVDSDLEEGEICDSEEDEAVVQNLENTHTASKLVKTSTEVKVKSTCSTSKSKLHSKIKDRERQKNDGDRHSRKKLILKQIDLRDKLKRKKSTERISERMNVAKISSHVRRDHDRSVDRDHLRYPLEKLSPPKNCHLHKNRRELNERTRDHRIHETSHDRVGVKEMRSRLKLKSPSYREKNNSHRRTDHSRDRHRSESRTWEHS
ncbi:hypothetical protein ScPMuIL_013438 [Solemya velum]